MSDADTQDQNTDTSDQQTQNTTTATTEPPWRNSLDADLRNNPGIQKYSSVSDLAKGYLESQSLIGKDKVVWPTDPNDKDGWAEINKKRGVPEKAEDYKLQYVKAPKGAGVDSFDRFGFQEQMKAIDASPAQAAKLWDNYTNMITEGVQAAQLELKTKTENVKSEMMQEMGEQYEGNVQRGQEAINFLVDTEDEANELTVALVGTSVGMKAMSKLGKVFGESEIGGFQEKKSYTLNPDEARMEIDNIRKNSDYKSDDERVRKPLFEREIELRKMLGTGTPQRRDII